MSEQGKDLKGAARGPALPDVDDEGYPTETALATIRTWHYKDLRGLMEFVRSVWHWPDWGWTEGIAEGDYPTFAISTGGWSGNEDVIAALQGNQVFWVICWRSSRRGGHYEFALPCPDASKASARKRPQKEELKP